MDDELERSSMRSLRKEIFTSHTLPRSFPGNVPLPDIDSLSWEHSPRADEIL